MNTCSACDALSTTEELSREEKGNSVPPRHWLVSSGLDCAWRRIQRTPDLQLKAGVAVSLHPSNGLQWLQCPSGISQNHGVAGAETIREVLVQRR